MRPDDASNLYQRLHRAPTLVIALAAAGISIDPRSDPPSRRETRSLGDFVAYKAFFGLARKEQDVADLFEAFDGWQGGVGCDGAGDPRALPLHVFDPGGDAPDLDTRNGREQFHASFGSPKCRLDRSDRVWERGPFHGRDELRVAGCVLPLGMHWDVSAKRNQCLVASAREVWQIKGAGYLNVYPDEFIRGPGSIHKRAVRRLWPPGHKKCPSKKRKGH